MKDKSPQDMNPDQQKAWRDGYAAGFKAATVMNPKPDAKQEERRRIVGILNAMAKTQDLQKIIDKINEED